MGRYGRKRKNTALRRCVVWGLLAAAAVPGVLSTAVLYDHARQTLGGFVTDTAVFSALYSVPDRALENLQRRFADEVASSPAEQPTTPQTAQQPTAPAEQEPETSSSEATDETPSEASQSPAVDASEIPENQQPPDDYSIPEEYQGPIIEEDMSVSDTTGYLSFGAGVIKNSTSLSDEEAQQYLEAENPVQIDSDGPQVLIMHTHATEDYRLSAGLWYRPGDGARSTDRSINMCAVGRVMADTLNAAGINTLHDETLNDYPSYTGSYANSRAVVQQYLARYPSIKVVLDVHRDAIETESGSRYAPVCTVDGRQAAQVMIICGCDNGTTVQLPGWRQNLRFAAAWERSMEGMYPGFTRPVLFSYRFYNQDLTTGSLLIEIGGHGNNLNEALYAGQLAAKGLAAALLGGA